MIFSNTCSILNDNNSFHTQWCVWHTNIIMGTNPELWWLDYLGEQSEHIFTWWIMIMTDLIDQRMNKMIFKMLFIIITANTTITWMNKDGVAHTVTSNTGIFDSGTINTNGIYSHLFSTAGSYPYHCSLHPSMTANITVN